MSTNVLEARVPEEALIPEALEDVLAYIESEFGITALGYLVDSEVEDGSAIEPLRNSGAAA